MPVATTEPDYAELRLTMVDRQIRTFGVTEHALIARFLEVPREKFVPASAKSLAYSDLPLRIDTGESEPRRLLTPMVLARLLQDAEVRPQDKVLDVACGTGYSTAIIAGLAKQVIALESAAQLQAAIKSNLASIGLDGLQVFAGPLADGVPAHAPFDLILVNGAVEARLERLFEQLREGGRLVTLRRAPRDPDRNACHAILFEKIAGQVSSRMLFDATAPILGAFRAEPQFVF